MKFWLALFSLCFQRSSNSSSDSIFFFYGWSHISSTLQIIALITLVFVSSNTTLNIFLLLTFKFILHFHHTTQGFWSLFFMQNKKKAFPYANQFGTNMKFSWVTPNDIQWISRIIYFANINNSFICFIFIMFRVLNIYLYFCYVVTTYMLQSGIIKYQLM